MLVWAKCATVVVLRRAVVLGNRHCIPIALDLAGFGAVSDGLAHNIAKLRIPGEVARESGVISPAIPI
jgi:hypothetical protein